MATISATILKHHKKKDGSWNVKIRITHKGDTKYIDTSIYATKLDVDTKIRLKNVFIDTYLTGTINEYRSKVNQLGVKAAHMTSADIKEFLLFNNEVVDFFRFAKDRAEVLINSTRKNSGLRKRANLKLFEKFVAKDTFPIELLTSKLLKKFEENLMDLGYSVLTIRTIMSDLQTFFNEAKSEFNDEELGLVRIHNSPFSKYKMPNAPESRKKGIDVSVEKLKFIRDATIINKSDALCRDLFMLSFYMLGTNANDFYEYLIDPSIERFEYTRNKTKAARKDKAFISIKVVDEARPIIKKLAGRLQKYKTARGLNNRLSYSFKHRLGNLFGIENFTYYHARHAFGTMAAGLGYTEHEIGLALNHRSQTITSVYISRDWTKIDEIQKAVLNLLK